MQPYTSPQHESSSCGSWGTIAAPLHHLPNISPRAAPAWQADNTQHAQYSQHAQQSEQANYSQQADYSPLGDAFCQLAVRQPLLPLGPAMHMHALTHKKDSSDLNVAFAPPQVGEEFADRLGGCSVQPSGCSQHNQQETLEETDAGFWEDLDSLLVATEEQGCESAGPSL